MRLDPSAALMQGCVSSPGGEIAGLQAKCEVDALYEVVLYLYT